MTTLKKWWEKEPPRFECQPNCFKCCTKPGVVYFDQASIKNAAGIIKINIENFKKEFLKFNDGQWVHEVESGKPCSFLTPQGCAIHHGKPTQCRAYPFWRENLTSKGMWKLVGAFCPGIGVGSSVPIKAIRNFLNQFKL